MILPECFNSLDKFVRNDEQNGVIEITNYFCHMLSKILISLFSLLGAISIVAQGCSSDEVRAKLSNIYQHHVHGEPEPGLKLCNEMLSCNPEYNLVAELKYMKTKFFRMKGQIDSAVYSIMSIDESRVGATEKQHINNQLGEILLTFESYNLSIPYLERMVDFGPDEVGSFYSLNLLGRAYMAMRDYDESIETFKRQYEIASGLKDQSLMVNAMNNQGFVHVDFGKNHLAVETLKMASEMLSAIDSLSYNDSVISLKIESNLARAYIELKEYTTAEMFLTPTYELSKEQKEYLHVNLGWDKAVSKMLFDAYLYQGEVIKAKEVRDYFNRLLNGEISYDLADMNYKLVLAEGSLAEIKDAALLKDSLASLERKDAKSVSQEKVELLGLFYLENANNKIKTEKLKREQMAAEAELNNLYIWLTVLLVGAVVIVVLVVLYQKKQKMTMKSQLLESEKQNIMYELELKEKDLGKLALDITQRVEWRKELIEDLTALSKLSEQESKSGIKKLISKTKSLMNSTAAMEEFQQNVNIVNEAFYKKLEARHPGLSQYDQEFCAFIKLGMSNHDIANIKNIELASVRTSKARVKKRLGLSNEDLFKYLQSI